MYNIGFKYRHVIHMRSRRVLPRGWVSSGAVGNINLFCVLLWLKCYWSAFAHGLRIPRASGPVWLNTNTHHFSIHSAPKLIFLGSTPACTFKTVPWGTPPFTGQRLETNFPIFTRCFRPVRKFLTHAIRIGCMSIPSILVIRK